MPTTLEIRDDRRSRSKSPGVRDRDKSRSRSRDTRRASPDRDEYRRSSKKYSPPSDSESEEDRRWYKTDKRSTSKKYYESDVEEDRYRSSKSAKEPRRRDVSISDDDRRYEKPKKRADSDLDRRREKPSRQDYDRTREAGSDLRREQKSSRREYDRSKDSDSEEDRRGYGDKNHRERNGRDEYGQSRGHETRHMSYDARSAAAPEPPTHPRNHSYSGQGGSRHADDEYRYAKLDKYTDKQEYERRRLADKRGDDDKADRNKTRDAKETKYHEDKYETREPRDKKYYDDRYEKKDKKYHTDKYGSSPDDATRKLASLSVSAGLGAATLGVARHHSHDGGKPPASPLLEAYKGTYQSISPMPSALVLANHKDDSDLSDLELDLDVDLNDPNADIKLKIRKLERQKEMYAREQERKASGTSSSSPPESRNSRRVSSIETDFEVREPGGKRDRDSILSPTGGHGKKKSVSFYDPTEDAKRIATALSGTRNAPDTRPLVQILPYLSTDDLLALRAEYKNHAKVSGQGINIAKHIKTRVSGNLGKAAYATALGRWESEAYWANSWYQGGASRRELLIESLMGRSNSDIREIKNCFKDKKYGDDLEKCIRTELKADKFRMAILLALEERRMPESSPIDIRMVKEDVVDLARALESPGGESDMIKIIVLRSDTHLREVLRLFERTYDANFARLMIAKSRNLVGETLAHVLNGALNRPMRDALLLHQAISETAPGKERTELLISRLIRLHWEPKHLEKVKHVYQERYGKDVEEAIRREVWSQMKTSEGRMCAEFCVALVDSSSAGYR